MGVRVHIIFAEVSTPVALRLVDGWTIVAQPQGLSSAESLATCRELLTDEERDVVRAGFGVPPMDSDPSKRAWLNKIPDRVCPCMIPEPLLAPWPFRSECRLHSPGAAPAPGSGAGAAGVTT